MSAKTVAGLILVLGVWAFWLEPSSLWVHERPIELVHWPKSLAGMRVAVLTDLHVGSPFKGLDQLPRIVERTNDAHPDIVLITGDLVIAGVKGGTSTPPKAITPILAKLKAPLGVWAVLGNHDWWYGAAATKLALEKDGIPVLDDRHVRLRFHGVPFWLVGVSDAWEGRHDIKQALNGIDDDAPIIAMTHNPDIFPDLPPRVNLLIAGHTHGGQVYIPLIGRPIEPSKFGQRFAIGHIVENDHDLFVSSGIGTSILGVRFLVPPEITILTLRPRPH
ncbi:MAG: metallophosphoesterase [Proteobacteria bacterium]|nr:metallophosphoesterase [Pseudomonadota bacterium]